MDQQTIPSGCVYLVGAGIGPLDYLTLQALHCLEQAEVLVYDDLVEPSLLQYLPPDCEQIWVGKRGGRPSTPQARINQLLIHHCQQGKRVVRLKSGDPLVFGRANAEIQALSEADCPFQVIPGLSSALAVPGLAGIPLTEKNLSRSFAVLTGHDPASLDWSALAGIDTLVILMGGQTLAPLVTHLLQSGRSPEDPMVIIRHGGRPSQQTWWGTLADMVEKTRGQSLSPAVIVLGPVVNQRFMPPQRPLSNKTIVVTRSAEQSSQFSQLLQAQGAQVLELPALVIQPPSSWQGLDQALAHLTTFDWLILTSANGVNFFFQRLEDHGQDSRALQGLKIAVVGQKTAQALKAYGLRPDFIPPQFIADDLVSHFPEPIADQRFLFPRVESGGREVLVQALTQQGGTVVEVPAYQSACPESLAPTILEALQQGQVDVVTFASAKTVQNFHTLLLQALDGDNQRLADYLAPVCLASIGPQTSQRCRELLGRVDLEAQEYTLEGLTQTLVTWAKGENWSTPSGVGSASPAIESPSLEVPTARAPRKRRQHSGRPGPQ
ncbi:uroporphyrinogen-III C-methyltransferase [Synechocystis sp. LKSZ1]|uniref:uroporphyrinogen-III C-methyltransferase n=1 Tax=Synechocystis sp. LKSZ1 TaxID=3144951 RepID=UPI00336BDC73